MIDTIVIDDVSYIVNTDFDNNGEIEYFNLEDSTGEIVYEADWQGQITAEEISELYTDYVNADKAPKKNGTPDKTEEIIVNTANAADLEFFDARFPYLVDYPERFKKLANAVYESSLNESYDYQNIVVSEFVGYFDECCLDGTDAVDEFYRTEEN